MQSTKAVKLDANDYLRLKVLGEIRNRSAHWLMKQAIKQFLDREEVAEHIRRDTLERWAHFEATGETVSHDVVAAWLDTWGSANEGECPVTNV